jgi:hypothetical protein
MIRLMIYLLKSNYAIQVRLFAESFVPVIKYKISDHSGRNGVVFRVEASLGCGRGRGAWSDWLWFYETRSVKGAYSQSQSSYKKILWSEYSLVL